MEAENPFSALRLLFVILLVSACSVRSSDVKKDANTDCLAQNTCRSCTHITRCSWSLDRQTCVDTERISGNLVVRLEEHCPRFDVVQKSAIGDSYEHRIKVTNDLKGFTTFLRDTEIQCRFGALKVPGHVDGNDVIACQTARRSAVEAVGNTMADGPIFHCHVTFANGTILRLDNDSDYYFSFFDRDRDCGGVNGTDRECVACTWSADNVVRHLRRCSADNRCTGPVEWYDARDSRDFAPAHDGGGSAGGDNSTATASAVRLACPETAVESVEPLWAPWAGGVTVRIAVRNHRILAENRTVTVTLAGRYCAYPTTVRRPPLGDAIACTVSPTARTDEPAEGPVVVVYGGTGEGQRSFAVASTQLFQFVVPEVLDVSPRCGPLEGGTEVTVIGRHLNAGSTVRVSLGGNRTCEPIERLENRIRCLTSTSGGNAPVSGAVSVMFDKSLVRPAAGGQRFSYTGPPRLAAGQRLAGIASGGTVVAVRGDAFACVSNASFYVQDRVADRRWYSTTGCRVLSDTLMACRSPELVNASLSAAAQNSDAAVLEAVAPDATPRPRDASTPLVFGVLAYVAGREHDLRSPQPLYDAFPDPTFDSFEIVNGSVVIAAAAGGYRGYRAEDVRVRFPSRTDARCDVTSVAHGRIVCASSAPDVVHKLRAIVVTVGDKYVSVVNWKTGTYDGYKVFSALSGSVLLTGIVLLCVRTLRQANLGGRRSPLFEMKVGTVTTSDKRSATADTYSVLTAGVPEKFNSNVQ